MLNLFNLTTPPCLRIFSYNLFKILLLTVVFLLSSLSSIGYAQQTANITLPELDDSLKAGLELKNVRDFKDVHFTKPQTWNILPGSNLVVSFNHSAELLPNRSYLNIFINGKLVKKEPLDKSSVETKTIAIPLPGGLGDYNTIHFEVEQHYTDVCEDPLDHSLWTNINQHTHISFKYSIKQPKVDLAKYPFPLYDPFAYGTTTINYVVPKGEGSDVRSLSALGIIAVDLAQKISWHKVNFIASSSEKPLNKEFNAVLVGTPSENPAIVRLNSALGASIQTLSGTPIFVDKEGNPIADDTGLIYFINNPENPNKAILVLTGNSPNAVYMAARYLANETLAKELKGNYKLADRYNPSKDKPSTVAKYIHNRSMSLHDLGYEDRKAIRIGPPPLKYHIKVMPDMNTSTGMLSLNLKYSYGPRLNDELSTLEVIVNGISLKSVRLDNRNGEKNKTLKVDIPAQYVKPYNFVDLLFNLYPEKFGYCTDWYDDDLYGIIHKDSVFNLPSDAKVVFPDMGLFNDMIYPYTVSQDLEDIAVIIPKVPSLEDFQAMLNILGAIGKNTNSDAGINLLVTPSELVNDSEISNKNIILIGTPDSNAMVNQLKEKLHFIFDPSYKKLKLASDQEAQLAYYNDQGILEQIISHLNTAKVITVFYGKTNKAVQNASIALSDKDKLISMYAGKFYTVDRDNLKKVMNSKNAQQKKIIAATKPTGIDSFWPPYDLWSWVITIAAGFVILIVAIILLKIVLSILFS